MLIGATLGQEAARRCQIDRALAAAGYRVTRIDPVGDSGIADFWPELGEETGMADREATSLSGHVTEAEVGHFELLAEPVIIDGIQVAGLDDLAGRKTAALVNRRQARDYPDVAALVARGYTAGRLLDLAHERDPALDPDDITAVGERLDMLPDSRFTPFLPDGRDPAWLRNALAGWPRPGR